MKKNSLNSLYDVTIHVLCTDNCRIKMIPDDNLTNYTTYFENVLSIVLYCIVNTDNTHKI